MLKLCAGIVAGLMLTLVASSGYAEGGQSAVSHQAESPQQTSPSYDRAGDTALRIRIVEPPEEAKTRERREAISAQNEKEDLEAQKGMAVSAAYTMYFTGLQIILSIGGFAGLFYTLYLTWTATRLAEESNKITRESAQRQLRPYIVYEATKTSVVRVDGDGRKRLELDISLRNSGLSPGILTAISNANYAPIGKGKWGPRENAWRPARIVFGPNQIERVRCSGIAVDKGGSFSWFRTGILIWYESLSGERFEEYVWLTYDGTGMRQDYNAVSGESLYRPSEE